MAPSAKMRRRRAAAAGERCEKCVKTATQEESPLRRTTWIQISRCLMKESWGGYENRVAAANLINHEFKGMSVSDGRGFFPCFPTQHAHAHQVADVFPVVHA